MEDCDARYPFFFFFFTFPIEIGDKVKRIWKLIKDDKLGDDGTRVELAELIKQCICYHDHLEGHNLELRNQISELEMKSKEREDELSAIMKKLENNENASLHAQKNELEEQMYVKSNEASTRAESNTNEVNVLRQEVESLQHQKSDLEVQLVEKSRENSECTIQIQSLKEEVERKTLEQERLMEDKENLTMRIRSLELEMGTIKSKSSEDEEQIKANIQAIIHLTQQKLELHDRIAKLEKISDERESELLVFQDKLNKAEEECLVVISTCKEKIKIHKDDQLSMYNEMQKLGQSIEKLKLEMDYIDNQKSVVEEQLRAKDCESNTLKQKVSENEKQIIAYCDHIAKLAQEKLELADKIDHSEKRLATREFEFSALLDKLSKAEEESSGKIIAFTAQVDNLQKDLLSLQKAKEELEHHCEKIREEHAQALTMVDNEKNELANKYLDLLRILEERDEEYKHVDSWYNDCQVKLKRAEWKMRKMAEMFLEDIYSKDQMVADLEHQVEDLRRDLEEKGDEVSSLLENVMNLEVKLCLSSQEEESFRKAEEKFQQVQRALEDRIATDNEAFHETITSIKECVNSMISGIDTISSKFSDDCNNYENRISNISYELQVAKECVSEMSREKGQLQTDKNHLLEELQGKKEEESTLQKKVEKLEAKARKDESEKMNVTATVVELKKTVEELEKSMKEKEEGMLDLGEEKREAIRQLCLRIDYHRECNVYLKGIISKTRRDQRGT